MLGLMISYCYPLINSQILLVDGSSSLVLTALALRTESNSSIFYVHNRNKMPG